MKRILSRSISPENLSGEKGKGALANIPLEELSSHPARNLGLGWKVLPSLKIKNGGKLVLANIEGEGAIKHIWLTCSSIKPRAFIFRIYWEDESLPAVETPLSDFFFSAWNKIDLINSFRVAVNPGKGFNSFWEMPFRKKARIELENLSGNDEYVYYQVDYELREVDEDELYFHAFYNRDNPLGYKKYHLILEDEGSGYFAGCFLSYCSHEPGWWGEGEVKVFLDGDVDSPTICFTGTEDYFLGSYDFKVNGQYKDFSGLYSGFHAHLGDGIIERNHRFSMYRIHEHDKIYFERNIKVEIPDIGWMPNADPCEFKILQDDLGSVAFYYLDSPKGNKKRIQDISILTKDCF